MKWKWSANTLQFQSLSQRLVLDKELSFNVIFFTFSSFFKVEKHKLSGATIQLDPLKQRYSPFLLNHRSWKSEHKIDEMFKSLLSLFNVDWKSRKFFIFQFFCFCFDERSEFASTTNAFDAIFLLPPSQRLPSTLRGTLTRFGNQK